MLLDFKCDSFAEGKNIFSFLSSPSFPYWFWHACDVNMHQQCHLDKSLLVEAGVAQQWWQKGEFHTDQINTDVK